MYLKSLTIKGFKSFAQATTFQFEPGITAIVGPNGSGKSNVVDALAWVMGEQGAKTLRGAKMEDVIFAGTSSRGPLGRAEVTVTIDNTDGALPIAYSEVTIRRTLFRQGSSEYAINGELCRLRDVQDLLSDSGLGREMHVIVGQGQLDAVLRATPEERRGFIEEAAGILKHRRRKERTLRKLDAMEANLTRLNDLSAELRKQLKPLGKQAEMARAAQRIAAVVRDAQARICADDLILVQNQFAQVSAEAAQLEADRASAQQQLSSDAAVLTGLEQGVQGPEVDTARRVVAGLERSLAALTGVATQAQQRAQFLRGQGNLGATVTTMSTAELAEANESLAECTALISPAERTVGLAEVRVREAVLALEESDADTADFRARVSAHEVAVERARGTLVAAERALSVRRDEQHRCSEVLSSARERLAEARIRFAASEAQSVEAAADEVGVSDADYEAARIAAAESELTVVACRERVHALQQEAGALEARTSALALAMQQRDASAAVLAAGDPEVSGRVSDHLTVRAGYEVAVAAALGTVAEGVLVRSADAGFRMVQHASEGDHGRVLVVVEHDPASELAGDARFAEVLQRHPEATALRGVVTADESVLGVLGSACGVADSVAARAVAASLRDAFPLGAWSVVTLAGEIHTAFTLVGGSAQAPSRIELQAESGVALSRLTQVQHELLAAQTDLDEVVRRSREATEAAGAVFVALRVADTRRGERAAEVQRVSLRLEAEQRETLRAEQACEAADAAVAEAELVLGESERSLSTLLAVTHEVPDPGLRVGLLSAVESARADEMAARVAREALREREVALRARAEQLEARFAAEQQAVERAVQRERVRRAQLDLAVSVGAAVPVVVRACERSLSDARAVLRSAEDSFRAAQIEVQRIRGSVEAQRVRVTQVTELLHASQLRNHEVTVQLAGVRERANELGLTEAVLRAEYGPHLLVPHDEPVDPLAGSETGGFSDRPGQPHATSLESELARELGVPEEAALEAADLLADPGGVPYVRAEQEQRLRAAQRRLSQLGRFNPLALEEFAALEQRHLFLSEQLGDLRQTRLDLMQIMRDLDVKMERIFAAAFTDTQVAFARVFPVLFPGGSGEISLTDPDEMLTTGIELTVRPAGKNVARMSLLSGGERSLAAIAWLLAIFHARPSPFYLMDEVEAALDDANLGRLLQSFTDLSASSQLIVITHQKRTMEIADVLYGVSMKQDGVSVVVGQKLTQLE